MNPRYRITRNASGDHPELSIPLEECKQFFAKHPDFIYTDSYSVRSAETVMTISGDFFMWQVANVQIPFRYYEGDLYVAISHDLIFQKMLEVAEGLNAQYVEG